MADQTRNNITHIIILLILVLALLGVLIFTGIIGCNVVPKGCELYYQYVKGGSPSILVVSGESGMGDAQKLAEALNERDFLNAQARTMDIDRLNYGNVRDYDLIIVEHAKKICTNKLKVFEYYINSGGRLVWTGDSGTQLCSGEQDGKYAQFDTYLLESERIEGGKAIPLGPWARKDANTQISFDQFLGVNYKGNYCEFVQCSSGQLAGRIEITNNSHKLTYGLSPSIPYHGDFAIVELNKDSTTRMVAALDYGESFVIRNSTKPWLEAGKSYNLGKTLPFIVSSGVGERVAYYSAPIESFISDDQPQKNLALIEQMYYGMLYE